MNGTSETERRSIGCACSSVYSVYSVYSVARLGMRMFRFVAVAIAAVLLFPSVPHGQSSPALTTDEQAHRHLRGRAQWRGAGAARARRQHQQRHAELCRRARGRQAVRGRVRSAGVHDPVGGRRAVQARGPSRRRARAAGPPRSPDRPSRHGVRGRQSVPEVRAAERSAGARARHHRHEGRRRHHRPGAQGAAARPARSTACTSRS